MPIYQTCPLPTRFNCWCYIFSVGRDACSHHPWLSEWILSLLSVSTRPPWIRNQRAYFRKETYFPSSPGRKTIIGNLPLLTGELPEWGDLRLVWRHEKEQMVGLLVRKRELGWTDSSRQATCQLDSWKSQRRKGKDHVQLFTMYGVHCVRHRIAAHELSCPVCLLTWKFLRTAWPWLSSLNAWSWKHSRNWINIYWIND